MLFAIKCIVSLIVICFIFVDTSSNQYVELDICIAFELYVNSNDPN